MAIVGGAGWDAKARTYFPMFAERLGLPVATAFRRQDAIDNSCPVYAGNLGYGPNPKLVERVSDADLLLVVGARLGEATTDGYTLVTPDHPGQLLVHVHPDPEELSRVYRADLAICADMAEFAERAPSGTTSSSPLRCGAEAHREWLDWSTPEPRDGIRLDLGQCVAAARAAAGRQHDLQRRGQFFGLVAPLLALRPVPPSSPRLPARWAMACPPRSPPRCASPNAAWSRVAGDGDFLMNGQELATAVQYGADLIVIVIDNGWYGTIRMHQEREFPGARERDRPRQPGFRRPRPGIWRLGGPGRDAPTIRRRAGRSAGRRASGCSTARPTFR